MVTQNLKIIMDDRKLPDIRMVSGDVGRDIFPAVYASEDAEEALDLTVYQLRVIFIKPDNTFVIEDYLDGMIEIPEQAGAVTGRGFYQIRISKTGEEIYSGQGDFYIDDYILNDSMVESIAEVNGLQFPDDFLTSADLSQYVTHDELSGYATTEYVDDAIAAIPSPLHEYSRTEKIVGTWLNGKPIYERTIQVLNSPYSLSSLDVDLVVNLSALIKLGSQGGLQWITSPYIESGSWRCDCHWQSSDNSIYIKSDWGHSDSEVTIQYTKSTD